MVGLTLSVALRVIFVPPLITDTFYMPQYATISKLANIDSSALRWGELS